MMNEVIVCFKIKFINLVIVTDFFVPAKQQGASSMELDQWNTKLHPTSEVDVTS